MKKVVIFTDGACSGNPGPGGYGIIIEWKKKNYIKEYSKGYKYTTNNRMEVWMGSSWAGIATVA